ncbi:hypothetical protein SAMN04487931_103101 [Desulfobacula phenolica]|uniref:Uncharacterized protein n=1 Tax=Desulfobacula phenolica TaxID=90732 RepID=A0A1H2EGE2_9BACT|nr:hypothetical protein SAMN04487931_103101 [Desulfobacula phenolica]
MMFKVIYDHILSYFIRTHAKITTSPESLPQYRFFNTGNSSNDLLAVLPFILRIISLGAIVGGSDTNM